MKKWALGVALGAALVGAVLAVLSTRQYLRIQREGLEEASYCTISALINCDVASASSYAAVAGVPVAWWGLVFYLLVLGFTTRAFISRRPQRGSVTFAWLMATVAVVYSIRMAIVLLKVLGVVCLECVGIYAVNLLLFIFLFVAIGVPLGQLTRFVIDYARAAIGRTSTLDFRPRLGTHLLIAGITLGLGWAVIHGAGAKGEMPSVIHVSLNEKLRAHAMGSIYPVEIDPRWPVWGNPEGEVVIVEFSDFECPFCKMAAFNLRPHLQEFREHVQLRYAHYPLDAECNNGGHKHSCLAARAAVCAQARGGFWEFHDDLFRQQRDLSPEAILALAHQHGWEEKDFQACLDDSATRQRVADDIAAGNHIYIHATPTIIVNGRNLHYWRDSELLQAIVREELEKSRK